MDINQLEQAAAVLQAVAEEQHAAEVHADEPTAADRLRAFEDKVLGKDVPRVNGKIEEGHGSAYRKMSPANRATHDLLVSLVDAQDRVSKANAELSAANVAYADLDAKAKGLGV